MGADLFIDYIISVSDEIDAAMHRYLSADSRDPSRYRYLYGILDEFIARGGKRTRPAMAMLACEAVGGDPRRALSSGCAIEFFHAAALIHDDIMDVSLLRRGEPCAHIIHGEPLAINAGDYALGLVCTIVVRDPILEDAVKLAVLDVIGEMSERTVEGQALDVGWVRDDLYDLTPDDYLDMALGKTGFYSGIAPLKAGAITGGATAQQIQAFEHFGKNVAIAFQIQDDLLNLVGDEKTMGKDYLSDVLESKRTLMVIHCLSKAEPADHERLVELLRLGHEKTREQAKEIVGLMERHGSIDYARAFARDLVADSGSFLEVLPASRARDILAGMALYFLERER
jgi:geranylgeranyl diphosphate synthase, type I